MDKEAEGLVERINALVETMIQMRVISSYCGSILINLFLRSRLCVV